MPPGLFLHLLLSLALSFLCLTRREQGRDALLLLLLLPLSTLFLVVLVAAMTVTVLRCVVLLIVTVAQTWRIFGT